MNFHSIGGEPEIASNFGQCPMDGDAASRLFEASSSMPRDFGRPPGRRMGHPVGLLAGLLAGVLTGFGVESSASAQAALSANGVSADFGRPLFWPWPDGRPGHGSWSRMMHRPLDQGVADRGALSESFRSFSVDLAVPMDFRQLFAVPSHDGNGGIDGATSGFYRAQGAIHAVFPESAYRSQGGFEMPLIPAGTVFHIGAPDQFIPGVASTRHHRHQADRSMHLDGLRVDGRLASEMLVANESTSAVDAIPANPRSVGARPTGERPTGATSIGATDVRAGHELEKDAPRLRRLDLPSRDASTADSDSPLPSFLRDEAYRRERLRDLPRVEHRRRD